MARTKFPVEVMTPEGDAWQGEVEMLSTRTVDGEIGVLANHAPLMAMLDPCELRLYEEGSNDPKGASPVRFAQGEGYLQVVENSALVLVEDAIPPDQLDRKDLEARLKESTERFERAQAALGKKPDDKELLGRQLGKPSPEDRAETEELRRSQAAVKRYEAFLEIAGGERS
jgi:F-type H+-transporting ATPase subunit epsilon